MTGTKKYSSLTFLTILVLILTACGSASNQATIATSVAMTVQAQNTLQAQFTPTPKPAINTPTMLASLASLTPISTKAPPTAPTAPTGSGNGLCTASASFVSETIPDGTIQSPGAIFTKIWRIKNTGTCSWNSTWKLVYVSGDLMGGAVIYNFPQPAAPGDTVDVPVVFTAPTASGSYRGYWKIQSPWGMTFGDSGSGNAFWVDINVGSGTPANSKTKTAYDVTNVTYETDVSLIRFCKPANTFYHYIAYISSNGPVKVTYEWDQSDGHNLHNRKIEFTSATTIAVSNDWSQGISSSQNPRWVQLIITSPTYQEWPKFTLPILCSQTP